MLSVRNLAKSYPPSRGREAGRIFAVEDLSLEIAEAELFTLLGPSGCGKTTTLRSIAGLETPERGEIVIGGRVVFSSERRIRVPANERGLGMVFQSYAIWPHMSAYKNVAFALESLPLRKRPPRRTIRERVERSLAVVRLDGVASRAATDLSGGQQQRLALARALVTEPPLLLLDEPLSNLDAKLREEMRFELQRLQRELGVTTVYVTHDQVEALAISSRVGVIRDGRIEQIGPPREVYERPRTRFVAEFIGASNLIEGVVVAYADGACVVRAAEGDVLVRTPERLPVGAPVLLSARPEQIEVGGASNGAGPNCWRGRVETSAFLGESVDYIVSVAGREIRARCHSRTSIPPATEVELRFSDEAFSLVAPE